ncbi:hypothetical protein ACXYMT_05380 [Salinimicrobium sp. CAU 1759]
MKTRGSCNRVKLLQIFAVIACTIAFMSCESKANKPEKVAENLETEISTEVRNSIPDSITTLLLDFAATDFHASQLSKPLEFRKVRAGYQITSGKNFQYVLCGEFMEQQKEEWMPFATIKTEPYEQWLGRQALSICEDPAMTFQNEKDLSKKLKDRMDVL